MSPPRLAMRRISLKPEHAPRGRVHYFVEGRPIPRPAMLEVIRPTTGDACHIIYIDSAQYEVAESWHPTLDAALLHAKWEFGVEPDEWEVLA